MCVGGGGDWKGLILQLIAFEFMYTADMHVVKNYNGLEFIIHHSSWLPHSTTYSLCGLDSQNL